jgi:branched-subunit amino acid aminotransferase/4-amino-4-deoxychorismate lyase
MSNIVFFNGAYMPADEARISIFDGGFLHGAGLFESMRADYGHAFRLDAHIDRLLHSAEKLGLPIARPDLPLTRDVDELLERNDLDTARLRLTVTVGSMLASAIDAERPALTVCLTAAALPPYPAELYARGMSVLVTTFKQSPSDPMCGHKTLNYLPRLLALRSAQRMQCGEALWFTPQNQLAEGSISNVFVAKSGAIATPPLQTPVLPGVSRAVVLELAGAAGIAAEEKPLNINDLLDADEVFLTNSSMMVMPVVRVEKHDIGTGKPGPLAQKLRAAFVELVRKECGPRA